MFNTTLFLLWLLRASLHPQTVTLRIFQTRNNRIFVWWCRTLSNPSLEQTKQTLVRIDKAMSIERNESERNDGDASMEVERRAGGQKTAYDSRREVRNPPLHHTTQGNGQIRQTLLIVILKRKYNYYFFQYYIIRKTFIEENSD